MGDIGLLATKVRGEEAYHVFVGGGFGANQAVGRQVFTGIVFEELKTTLEEDAQRLPAPIASRARPSPVHPTAGRRQLSRPSFPTTNDLARPQRRAHAHRTNCRGTAAVDGRRTVCLAQGPPRRCRSGQALPRVLPARAPGPGQQYAFAVDLDSCSGCKACVTACHSLNGLDEDETWRSVGSSHGGARQRPRATNGYHRLSSLRRAGLPSGLPGAGLRKGRGDRHRAALGRPVHRVPVLHPEVPLRRAAVLGQARDCAEMRHVLGPAGGG